MGPFQRVKDRAVARAPALSVVLAQSGLWALGPWAPLVIAGMLAGPLSDQTLTYLVGLSAVQMVFMAWRLRRVGVYLDDGAVVVRNVLWTHRLAAPVRREPSRSSWWALKPWVVAVLRSDLTSHRCKVFGCQEEDLDELCRVLIRNGMMVRRTRAPERRSRRRR